MQITPAWPWPPLHQGGGPWVRPLATPSNGAWPRHCVTWPSPTPTRPVISWPTKLGAVLAMLPDLQRRFLSGDFVGTQEPASTRRWR